MIVNNKQEQTKAVLAAASALATAVNMRLLGHGVSNMVAGNTVTRAAVSASSLAVFSKHARSL